MDWPPILMEWSVTEDSSLGGAAAGSADFSAGFSAGLDSFSCAREFAGANANKESAAHNRVRRVAGVIFGFFLSTGDGGAFFSVFLSIFWGRGIFPRGIVLFDGVLGGGGGAPREASPIGWR